MTKLICFDFDGTLCNSWPPFQKAAVRFTEMNGLPELCLDSLMVGYGYPDEYEFWKGMDKQTQRDTLETLYRIVDDPHHEIMDGNFPVLFDGVVDTLEGLKQNGHTLAIVTARPRDPLNIILNHFDLRKYFDTVRDYDDVKDRGERCKPHPDQLLSVMRELGFQSENTFMVGDTCMDMKMGTAAGVRTIGVTWGNHCINRLTEGGAVHVVSEKFSDLGDIIHNWRAEFEAA